MYRVGNFEKVSYEQFHEAMKELFYTEYEEELIRSAYDDLKLPERATSGSAGYDFKSPFTFTLAPGATMKIPTGIRVKIDEGWWLGCLPRSGLGFKFRFQLDNTVGVIDSDYAHSDNEGHIFMRMTNDSREGKGLRVPAGTAFAQGVFLPFGITVDDDVKAVRNGGLGSTTRV